MSNFILEHPMLLVAIGTWLILISISIAIKLILNTGQTNSVNTDFAKGYASGVKEEFQHCQRLHAQSIDELQKSYFFILGPKKFIELQLQYLKNKK